MVDHPWLHLEAGMAIALGAPVLVAADVEVREGVFNPAVWHGDVYGSLLTDVGRGSENWLSSIHARADRRISEAGRGI
jgi:hypothetical protein